MYHLSIPYSPPMCDLDYYSVCAEIQKKSILRRKARRKKRDTANTVSMEGCRNHRRGSLSSAYTYDSIDPTKIECTM